MASKIVKTTDSNGQIVSVATEDAVTLLRRIVKLLESNAVTDSNQRQRIMLDASLGSSATALMTVALTTNSVGAAAGYPIGTAVMTFGSDNLNRIDSRYFMLDTARNCYANSIRSKLNWS